MASRAELQRLRERVEVVTGTPGVCTCNGGVRLFVVSNGHTPTENERVAAHTCPDCGGEARTVVFLSRDFAEVCGGL